MVRSSFSELFIAGFTPRYCSMVLPQLGYAIEANSLKRVQRHVPYEERLRQINLFSLKRTRLRADLILAFKVFYGKLTYAHSIPSPNWVERKLSYRIRQGPNRLRRRSGVLSVRVENSGTGCRLLFSFRPSVPVFKKQLDQQCLITVPRNCSFTFIVTPYY